MNSREAVVKEAREWLRTPYHLGQCLKGVGCDCATLLLGVYRACGVLAAETENHSVTGGDWWLHTTSEQYLFRALRHASKTLEAVCYRTLEILPGNAVLTRAAGSRIYNHGGIVTSWPMIIHSVGDFGVCEVDASKNPLWSYHQINVLDPWEQPK